MGGNRYYRGAVSDHFDGTLFFNPGQPSTDRSFGELLRWRLTGERADWGRDVPATAPVRPAARVEGVAVTMIGHASVLIQVAGHNLLVDPVWSERAGPFGLVGPRRVNAPGVRFEDLPPVDTVLLSHNHYDHMDAETLARLGAGHGPRVIAPLGNDAVLARAVPGLRVETGDWGARFALGPGLGVVLHPAYHWSARGPRDRRMALWCGFVLESPVGVVYVAGDTAYGDGVIFRLVRERFGAPLVAVLPIGAYEPRWFMRNQHADPEEAVRMMRDCGAGQALGVHWGTFQLTDEARLAPVEGLEAALRRDGVEAGRFLALEAGTVWRG